MKNINEPTTEQLKLQKFLEEHLEEGETVLWQGKPDMNLCFEKKHFLTTGLIFLGLQSIFLLFHKSIFGYLFLMFFYLIGFVTELVPWFNRKRNTFYAITDRRAVDLFFNNGYIKINEKRFPNEIKVFRIRRLKNGGNLYMSRGSVWPWREISENPYKEPLVPTFKILVNYINNINYFCFFDLADVDTPAALIRQYTNAEEYIDPKQRAREEKMKKRAEGKHEKQ